MKSHHTISNQTHMRLPTKRIATATTFAAPSTTEMITLMEMLRAVPFKSVGGGGGTEAN